MRQTTHPAPSEQESTASLLIEALVSTVGGCAQAETVLETYLDRLERAS